MSIFTRRAQRSTKPQADPGVQFSTAIGRPLPSTLYGTTVESVASLTALNTSLGMHTKRPTTRVVFQSGMNSTDYAAAVPNLRNVSYIFGQLYDSTAFSQASIAACEARTRDFLNRFGESIDIYEIGNELNGEWVGGSQAEIDAKVLAIYNVIKTEYASLNIRTAITLNYWPTTNYYSFPWEKTETYAQNMPATLRNGVDYILLSFYETTGDPPVQPTDQNFATVLTTMATYFPNSKIGMGEIGAQGVADGLPSNPTLAEKQRIANRYYGMHNSVKSLLGANGSRYVGGYFWWYYYQDAVPYNKTNTMWPTIESNFNAY